MARKPGGKRPAKKPTSGKTKKRSSGPAEIRADSYEHVEAEVANSPEIGTQAGFKKYRAEFKLDGVWIAARYFTRLSNAERWVKRATDHGWEARYEIE